MKENMNIEIHKPKSEVWVIYKGKSYCTYIKKVEIYMYGGIYDDESKYSVMYEVANHANPIKDLRYKPKDIFSTKEELLNAL